ncbi:MAG: MBL fold metallo-hydrolase [Alphaproteobacteria bacterium]|nr:MBL fold metallo-hydrolase [Alphaproteobacteria bacterium]MCB9791871.1 MBL fold metallo-hydrolase [Alphaproteobacteria bacterium]
MSTARWGGNSSCVEISAGDAILIFDCGTGARPLGRDLFSRPARQLDLLFTHFHMDHLIGFPFFGPVYAPGYQVRVTVPAFSVEEAKDRLGRFVNGVYHPLRIREIPADLSFLPIQPGKAFQRGPFKVTGVRLNHPGGAVGYRVEHGDHVACYLTDTAPLARPGEGVAAGQAPPAAERQVLDAMKGADVVIFDTMFTFDEYLEKMTWGHAYPEYAVALCKEAGVKHLVMFHHAPDASDDFLDGLAAQWEAHESPRITLAREGETVDLEG